LHFYKLGPQKNTSYLADTRFAILVHKINQLYESINPKNKHEKEKTEKCGPSSLDRKYAS